MPTAIAILVIVLMAAGAYYLWRFMLARALRAVVSAFRQHKATDAKRAVTLEALGLQQRKGLFGPFFKARDHRQTAMRVMAQEGIIRMAEGERFYLSEDALAQSRVKRFAHLD
jgi:hypothetical protein